MDYEKLSSKALGCMYMATFAATLVGAAVVGALNLFLFFPFEIEIGKLVSIIVLLIMTFNMIISPYFRFHRYRYSINAECIDIIEGYLFVERNIVPIERLHKIQMLRGPIDKLFGVEKVVVTTAGGDVTIRFLEEEKAERIADALQKRINEIVVNERNASNEDQCKKLVVEGTAEVETKAEEKKECAEHYGEV